MGASSDTLMAPGQCTWDTRTYTSTDVQSPDALYFSGVILLPASVQLPTSLTLQLGLQRGPAESPHFPTIHVVRQSAGEGNSGSELRIRFSIPDLLIPLSRGQSSIRIVKAKFWLGCCTAGLPISDTHTKNQFANEPEGLQQFRDHRWKGLGEENSDLSGLFFCGHFLTS